MTDSGNRDAFVKAESVRISSGSVIRGQVVGRYVLLRHLSHLEMKVREELGEDVRAFKVRLLTGCCQECYARVAY